MADTEVKIVDSDLPEWATEVTMKKVMDAMEQLVDLTEKQKRDMESGFKDMKATGKATRDNIKKASAGKGASNNIFSDVTSGLGKFVKGVNDGAETLDDWAGGPLKDLSKGTSDAAKRMGLIGGAFALLGAQIGAAIGDIKETVGVLRDMNHAGVLIEGGFQGLRQTMAETGMSLGEVQEITNQYTRTVGNVGLNSILDMAAAAEDSSFQFREYGLLVAEGAEFQAKMLESQRLGGIFRVRDERAQSMALQENIQNLTAYSRILNVSREDMAAQQLEMKSRADVMRRFNSMDDASRESANRSFDQFSAIIAALGPEAKGLGDMMTTIIADPAAVNSEAFQTLASASPEAAQAILQLRDQILSGEDVDPSHIVDRLLGPLDRAAQSGQLEMLSMNDALSETVNMLGGPVLNSLRNWESRVGDAAGENLAEKMDNLANDTDGAVSAAVGLDQELRNLSQTIKSSRIDVFMNLLGNEAAAGVEGLTNAVAWVTEKIETLGNIDYRGYIMDAFNAIKEFGESVNNWLQGVWMGIKDGLSSLWNGIKAIIDKIVGFPGQIWNWFAEKLPFVDPISEAEAYGTGGGLPPAAPMPAGATLSDFNAAQQAVAGRQATLEQAIASGASPEQIALWERSVVAAEQTLAEIKRIRTAGPNALTDQ